MRTNRRGSNIVEFALLFPLYVGFVMGIVDYGWLTYQKSAVTAATQEGCRSASMLDPGIGEVDLDDVYAAANARMKAKVIAKGLHCAVDCTQTTLVIGSYPNRAIRCDLDVPFTAITGLSPTPDSLSSRAVVRLEYQRR